MSGKGGARNRDHGWYPYLLPMLAFLLLAEIERRAAVAPGVFLALKAAIPGGLLVFYAARGSYPELRGYRQLGGAGLDVLVGVLGAVLWMAPYLLFASLRPHGDEPFDPEMLGPARVGLVLALRAAGYGIVTPFVEELFVRSFVPRVVDGTIERRDFRTIPLARFSWPSFVVVLVYFTFSHMPWEYPVAFAWVLATQLWFYHRRHIGALVVVHAGSNLAILLSVALASGHIAGPDGHPLDLWFFL